jgi:hypothetical protein
VDRFLDMDTDEIASSGRHDDVILCRLEEFVGKLDASVKKVRDVREKEKNATIELEEKRKREADVEAEYKCMYENKICFDCKIIMNDLKECVCLSSDSFHGYSNVLSICEGCFEKRKDAGLQICAECNNILCDNCDSFKCGREGGGCGNVVCYPCVDSNYNATECEACGNWFCKSCEDKCYEKVLCYKCSYNNNSQMVCPACESDYEANKKCGYKEDGKIGGCQYGNAAGGCGQPVCDECVRQTYCGDPTRLCDDCQHEHACECRTCYSYM